MNTVNRDLEGRRSVTWQTQPPPGECEHDYLVIAREEDGALAQCSKCGRLETV